MARQREVIETTAGMASAELARRGFDSDDRVMITIEPETGLVPGRHESRRLVIAAGLSDEDIDRLIEEARNEVQPLIK
jgi:hypothetical protein